MLPLFAACLFFDVKVKLSQIVQNEQSFSFPYILIKETYQYNETKLKGYAFGFQEI